MRGNGRPSGHVLYSVQKFSMLSNPQARQLAALTGTRLVTTFNMKAAMCISVPHGEEVVRGGGTEVEMPERSNSQEVVVSVQPFRSCRLPRGLYCF